MDELNDAGIVGRENLCETAAEGVDSGVDVVVGDEVIRASTFV
jgi:hypothetical protein